MRKKPMAGLWLIAVFALVAFMLMRGPTRVDPTLLPVSEFIQKVEAGEIKDVTISGDSIVGATATGQAAKFATYASDKETLLKALQEKDAVYREEPGAERSGWTSVLISLAPLLLMVFLLWFLMRGMAKAQGGAIRNISASRAMLHHESTVTFKDVAGIPEAIEEVQEVVDYLKNPQQFLRLGGRVPKGVLLYGPPGTGKTLLARAVAGEAGISFYSVAASSFVEMFVGVGASRVRDMFQEAAKHKPCIIFIDELDAIGRQRGGFAGGGNDERDQTLNQLLTEMDGFTSNEGIFVIAATNRPEPLDSALTRSGRFDRRVEVGPPNQEGRAQIFGIHARGKPLDKSVDLMRAAQLTTGLTGADIELIMNEASLRAAKAGQNVLTMADIEYSIEKKYLGKPLVSRQLTGHLKQLVAAHESGHAIIGHLDPKSAPVDKVTILPRNSALGLTFFTPEEEMQLQSKSTLRAMIRSLYGGRAAEHLLFGDDEVTLGAGNDIDRVTAIASSMAKRFGMLGKPGEPPRSYAIAERGIVFENSRKDHSEATEAKLDDMILDELRPLWVSVVSQLEQYKPQLLQMTNMLLERETISREDVAAILGPRPVAPAIMVSGLPHPDTHVKKGATPVAVAPAVPAPAPAPAVPGTK